MEYKKDITEQQMLAQLLPGEWGLPPLELLEVNTMDPFDALITLGWQGQRYRFGVEMKKLWTPKAVTEVAEQVLKNAQRQKLYPLIIVPFLGEQRLRELEARGISGIDLCGNGVVIIPGQLLVFRSGYPNRYRWEGKIKNVYRGASAAVARVFLLQPEYKSVREALDKIRSLGGAVTLPTVSKVCNNLEQDLVIERARGETPLSRRLRLLQPEKLLDLLRANYVPPKITGVFTGKFTGPNEALIDALLEWEKQQGGKVALTGECSVDAYAVMARERLQVFYCSEVGRLKKNLGENLVETERFATVQFLETQENLVYFDRRPKLVASPLQTYLELAVGEKREKETAEQVRRYILNQLPLKEKGR
jgi:hypothetical protein